MGVRWGGGEARGGGGAGIMTPPLNSCVAVGSYRTGLLNCKVGRW